MIKYDNYKDSGVDWLGEIPEHWSINRNKNIFREISKLSKTGDETLLTVSHITGVTPRSEKNVNMFFAETMEGYKICQEGDLVINTMWAWMGALGTSRYHGICSPAYNVYRNINGIDYSHQYFDYLFRTPNFVVEMTRLSKGIVESRLRLYPKDFFIIQTPLPLLSEQTAIATYLDSKTSAIDRKVALLEQKITHYQQLRKSLINETVCRGLDKTVKLKESGIVWIGEIPEHWPIKRIKDLTEVKRGASPRPIDDPIFFDDNGEFAWVRISDLTASERYLEFTKEKLSTLGASLSVKRYPKDFILSIAGTVGKPIITKIKCCIHDGFVWFPNLKIDCEYLFYIFSTGLPYQGLGKLGTQLNLNTETVGLISIPLPSNSEIIEIVSYLDDKVQKIESIITNLKAQIETLKELRKTLINDVVTGKIKVTA